nr:hypothetical protein CFP56_13591 [Quercus suber]
MRSFDWNYMTPDPSSWEVHSNTPRHQDVYVIEYQMYHVTHAVLCKCYRGTCISHQESNQTELALGRSCPCSFLKWRTMRKGWVQWWSS